MKPEIQTIKLTFRDKVIEMEADNFSGVGEIEACLLYAYYRTSRQALEACGNPNCNACEARRAIVKLLKKIMTAANIKESLIKERHEKKSDDKKDGGKISPYSPVPKKK